VRFLVNAKARKITKSTSASHTRWWHPSARSSRLATAETRYIGLRKRRCPSRSRRHTRRRRLTKTRIPATPSLTELRGCDQARIHHAQKGGGVFTLVAYNSQIPHSSKALSSWGLQPSTEESPAVSQPTPYPKRVTGVLTCRSAR